MGGSFEGMLHYIKAGFVQRAYGAVRDRSSTSFYYSLGRSGAAAWQA
jgi:hypothetical protein